MKKIIRTKTFIHLLIVSLAMAGAAFIWITVFPAKSKFDTEDIIFESVNLFLLYMGYIVLLKFNSKIMEIGWVCILFSILIDVVDEFTKDPDFWSSYAQDSLGLFGLFLAVGGLFLTIKRIEKELAESQRIRKLLKKSEKKYWNIIENIEHITSNMLYYIKSINEKGTFFNPDTEEEMAGSLAQVISFEDDEGEEAKESTATFNRLLHNIQQMNLSLLEKERIKYKMTMAKQIQLTSLPEIVDKAAYQMSAAMIPADDIGGDFYDYIITESGRVIYIIGDVSGHGLNAGLLMFMVQSSVRTLLLSKPSITVEQLVCELNTFLYKTIVERMKLKEFATFLAAEEFENGRFEIAGFHPFPLIYRASTGKCDEIHVEGLYLGFKKNIEDVVKKSVFFLDEGDILILYTDGIIEARSGNRHLYEYERYKKVICENSSLSMSELAAAIIKDVQDFMDIQKDDMTLFLIKREAGVFSPAPEAKE